MQQQRKAPVTTNPSVSSVLLFHLSCGLGLASAFWVAFNLYSLTLIQNSAKTLFILWAVEASIVILASSLFRRDPDKCSYVKAVARGLLGLPAGALLNALGAIVLGAPFGIQHFRKTVNWSLLMSVLTFVPTASVFGSSWTHWTDWHRIFAHAKPIESTDFIICIPAHGAVIGAWLGAWPMPLDWERDWQAFCSTEAFILTDTNADITWEQEWPICVTYGAILGYLIGMVVSYGFVAFRSRRHYEKRD